MRSLKFNAHLKNAFLAIANPTSAEQCFGAELSDLITAHSAVVGSYEELPNILLTVVKNAVVGCALKFRVRMLLKGAVIYQKIRTYLHIRICVSP